jgi:hypothetical protein
MIRGNMIVVHVVLFVAKYPESVETCSGQEVLLAIVAASHSPLQPTNST